MISSRSSILALVLFLFCGSAYAGNWEAQVVRGEKAGKKGKGRIGNLTFSSERFPADVAGSPEEPAAKVVIRGTFDHEGWNLLWRDDGDIKKIPSSQGEFTVETELDGPEKTLRLQAIGPLGEVEKEKLTLKLDEWDELVASVKVAAPIEAPWLVSLGTSFITYSQSDSSGALPDYTMTGLTLKGAYSRKLMSDNWEASGSAYLTLLPLSRSNPDVTVRFFGLNGRVGYRLPNITEPWQLTLMGGWYYFTMLVSDNLFGFKNLNGPQIYPVLRRKIGARDVASAYVKYSLALDGIQVLGFNDRELAGGLAWTRYLRNGHPVTLSLDVANVSFSVGKSVSDTSTTIGLGYGF